MRSAVFSMGLAVLAMGVFITSAEAKARVPNHTHAGTFVSAGAGKLVMTGHNGKEHTHALAATAKVMIDGKPGALTGLKKGMHVSVTTDNSGTVTAISTVAAKPATTAKPAATAAKPVAPAGATSPAVPATSAGK